MSPCDKPWQVVIHTVLATAGSLWLSQGLASMFHLSTESNMAYVKYIPLPDTFSFSRSEI